MGVALSGQAQLVNPGFEEWSTATGVNEPVGWTTFNPLGELFGVTFAEQGTPGAVGNSYLSMTVRELSEGTVLSSLVVGGNAGEGHDGFPWTTRPTSLEGRYRFFPQAEDEGQVIVAFYRWDPVTEARIGLGGGFWSVEENTAEWTTFTVPITFYEVGTPDTVSISFFSGGSVPQVGTRFDVDAIGLNGDLTSISEPHEPNALLLSPSPAADVLWWTREEYVDAFTWRMHDMEGRVVAEGNAAGPRGSVDVSALNSGCYVLRTSSRIGGFTVTRFVKD